MCGIVGYIGPENATDILLEGLRRLEYRGYDSAGIAVISDGELNIRRSVGKIINLDEAIHDAPLKGNTGVGHTRWATHGKPSEENAHPHRDCSGKLVVVHNGIIENYRALKQELVKTGHTMASETDTEVIVHLVESHFKGNLEKALRETIRELDGVYALVVMHTDDPDTLVAARSGPPLVIGLGEGEMFIASDIPAVLHHTTAVSCTWKTGRSLQLQLIMYALQTSMEPRLRSTRSLYRGTRSWPKKAATSTSCTRRYTSSPRLWLTPSGDAISRKTERSPWTTSTSMTLS